MIRSLLLFFCILIALNPLAAQQRSENLNSILTHNFYTEYKAPEKRKLLNFKNKSFIKKLNPVIYLSAGLLFLYQRVASEQIQASCNYEISCSGYMKGQIEQNGFRGFLLGINQLNNCFQAVIYDQQRYQISNNSMVINPIEKIDP
jgi:uncharacterized protein